MPYDQNGIWYDDEQQNPVYQDPHPAESQQLQIPGSGYGGTPPAPTLPPSQRPTVEREPIPSQPGQPAQNFTQSQADIDSALAALAQRAPVTAPGASQIATTAVPTAQKIATTAGPTAATVAATAAPTAARIGDVASAGAPGVAPVSLSSPAAIEAYLAERSKVAGRQLSLADMLEEQARGGVESPGALAVRRELDDAEAAQMSMAASLGPASRAAGLRAALQNTGRIRGAANTEIANRNLAAQVEARNQLAGVLGTTRGQDIAEQTAEMDAINAARMKTAELGTQTSIAGAQIAGQQSIAEAGFKSAAELANAQAANAARMRQAELDTQNAQFGAELEQTRNLRQSDYAHETGLKEYETEAARATREAELAQQTGLQQYETEAARAMRQAELDQSAGLEGAKLQLEDQAQRDRFTNDLFSRRSDLLELVQRGDISREQLESAMNIAQLQAETSIKLGEMSEPDAWDRALGLVGDVLTAGATFAIRGRRREGVKRARLVE